MDLRRFGSHVRTLGTTASRRQAFSAFLSGLFALLVLGLAAEAGRGKRRRKERSHHRPKRHGASQSDRCGRVHGDARGRKGGGAIFCRTTMPNGSRNDTGCAKGTPCCPTCAETRRCARGQLCCNGSCLTGDCCADGERPDPEKPICRGNICAACPSDARCGNGQRCGGQCKRGICCTDKECADRRCQAKSCTDNQCVYRPAADGEACNDNDPRTVGDVCRNGVCAGTPGAEVLQSARRHVHRRGRLLLCPRRADLHQWEMLRAGRVRLRRR